MADSNYNRHLLDETNRALEKGAWVAMALAGFAAVAIPATLLSGLGEGLWTPWLFAVLAFGACASLLILARKRRMHGAVAWLVMLCFVSMPTAFYLANEAFLPSGAATFLNGPLTYLYFVLIAVTGMLFDFRLSVAAGFVTALGFLGCTFVGAEHLAQFEHPDPLTRQDIAAPAIYFHRAVMMVTSGFVVGYLGIVARRLTGRVVNEATQRRELDRLFGVYVSPEVKDKLLHAPPPRSGERREVVILFSDIRGFTTISERSDPSELVARLNEYFDAMAEPIARHDGVIDKFVGDAIMAVFGGVIDVEAPCSQALRAAQGMREALRRLNGSWKERGLDPFDNGIGLHVGEVVQGSIGASMRKDFTVIGDAVNIAARVEGLTKQPRGADPADGRRPPAPRPGAPVGMHGDRRDPRERQGPSGAVVSIR